MKKQDIENAIKSYSGINGITFGVDGRHVDTHIGNIELLENIAILKTDLNTVYMPYETIEYISIVGRPDLDKGE